MEKMPTNRAAYLTKPLVTPFDVREAPYTPAKENQIVVKNHAVAINPIDWIIQSTPPGLSFQWLKYPFIMGSDVAGEVVEIGPGVTRFKVGDRVLGHAAGDDKSQNTPAQKGFQTYTVLLTYLTSKIPNNVSYDQASVLPLGCSTAACGLFEKDQLGLQLPAAPAARSTGKTVLIWGGSTSVGVNAIQLAAAAGYEVSTTCSPRNFDLVKRLGATEAYDYNSKTIVQDLTTAMQKRTLAGALTAGRGGAEAFLQVFPKCTGNKVIAMANFPMPDPMPTRFVLPKIMFAFVSWTIAHKISLWRTGSSSNFIWGVPKPEGGVGQAVYEQFLPQALTKGSYTCAPEALVVGHGLESLQAACDQQKKGVSAKKLVVTL